MLSPQLWSIMTTSDDLPLVPGYQTPESRRPSTVGSETASSFLSWPAAGDAGTASKRQAIKKAAREPHWNRRISVSPERRGTAFPKSRTLLDNKTFALVNQEEQRPAKRSQPIKRCIRN